MVLDLVSGLAGDHLSGKGMHLDRKQLRQASQGTEPYLLASHVDSAYLQGLGHIPEVD